MADGSISSDTVRIKREIGGLGGWFGRVRTRWWFRILAVLALLAGILVLAVWLLVARNLPSVDTLRTYEPPLPTYVRSVEGTPIHSYARERRVQLSYDEYPRSMFTTGPDQTLPLAVMAQLDRQLTPEIYAIGTTTTVFSLIAVLLCTSALWAMRRSTSLRKA